MHIGMAIAMIAVGALLMMAINFTGGLVLLMVGLLGIVLSFLTAAPARQIIMERPAPRDRMLRPERKL